MRVLLISLFLWTAVSAGNNDCPNDCSGMGTCDPTTGSCTCNAGCYGDDCSVVCPGFPNVCCAGMGTPVYNPSTNTATCDCDPGCFGDDCSLFACTKDCSGRGTCDSATGTCNCNEGCFGEDCNSNDNTDKCECNIGFYGTDCTVTCPKDCSGMGTCEPSTITVAADIPQCTKASWIGDNICDELNNKAECLFDKGDCCKSPEEAPRVHDYCLDNGDLKPGCACINVGTCNCDGGVYGDDCSQFTCPNDCSSMGTCDPTTGSCTCMEGCFGDDCSAVCPGFPDCCADMGTPVYDPSTNTTTCDCMEGCYGDGCTTVCPGFPDCCADMGTPVYDPSTNTATCDCMEGCYGDGCTAVCPGFPDCCAGLGTSVYEASTDTATCACTEGSYGDDCSVGCPNNCSGMGGCNYDSSANTASCDCMHGCYGDDCSVVCPRNCDGKGLCVYDENTNSAECSCEAAVAELEELSQQSYMHSHSGAIHLGQGDEVWSTKYWGRQFKIEFDIQVTEALSSSSSSSYVNVFHFTKGGDGSYYGDRIPAVFARKTGYKTYFYISSAVSGTVNYYQKFEYQLNQWYHFEIKQAENSNGQIIYSIKMDGVSVHEVENTLPTRFEEVILYESDPWYTSFASFGELKNLFIVNLDIAESAEKTNKLEKMTYESFEYSHSGVVASGKGDVVWSTKYWGREFNVKFDIQVTKELSSSSSSSYMNVFHITQGGDYSTYGDRIPAVWAKKTSYKTFFLIRSAVSGNLNYGEHFECELNQWYHFEIKQEENSNGEIIYSIKIDGHTVHEVVNTTPQRFKEVILYESDPWYESFASFGELKNLKIVNSEKDHHA